MNTCSKSKSWSSLSISAACALSFLLQTVEPLQWFFSPHTHTTFFSLSGKEVLVKHMSGETKFALNFLWCSWFSSGFGLWCFQPCILMKNFRYFLLIGHLLTLSSEKCQCNVLTQDFTLARVAFVWYYLRSRGLFDLKFPSHSCIYKNYMILKDFLILWDSCLVDFTSELLVKLLNDCVNVRVVFITSEVEGVITIA